MEDFLHSKDDNSVPEEDRHFTISKKGVEEILGWIRFQAQICEMMHQDDPESCDEKEHEIALLMAFALHPWIEFYNIETKGEE